MGHGYWCAPAHEVCLTTDQGYLLNFDLHHLTEPVEGYIQSSKPEIQPWPAYSVCSDIGAVPDEVRV